MNKVNIPIKVLVVFEPGKVPLPYKVKGKYASGGEFMMHVDVVENIDTRARDFILYDCMTIYGDYNKKYKLVYMYRKCNWFLYMV